MGDMKSTSVALRIVDNRQSKKPHILKQFLVWLIVPGVVFWPGVIVGSAAMQWAGFILFILMTIVIMMRFFDSYMTIEEARQKLDKMEREQRND